MDRKTSNLDLDSLPWIKVKKNSGSDLLQTVNAYAGERPIFVPPKARYRIPDSLVLPSGSFLMGNRSSVGGSPSNGAIIEGGNLDIIKTVAGTVSQAVVLSNLTLWGRRAVSGITSGNGIKGSFRSGWFENLFIYDCDEDGFVIDALSGETQLWDNHLVACHIYWNDGYGFKAGSVCSDTKIMGGNISDNGLAAFYATTLGNHRLTDVTLQKSQYGAFLDNGATMTMKGGSVDQIQYDGVQFVNSTIGCIMGTKFRRCGQATDSYYSDIYLNGASNIRIGMNSHRIDGATNGVRFCIGYVNATDLFKALLEDFTGGYRSFRTGLGRAGASETLPTGGENAHYMG